MSKCSCADVWIAAEVPFLVDLDGRRQTALEIAVIDEVLARGTDTAGADRLSDIIVCFYIPFFVHVDPADQQLQKFNEVLIRDVDPQIAAHRLNVDRPADELERRKIFHDHSFGRRRRSGSRPCNAAPWAREPESA